MQNSVIESAPRSASADTGFSQKASKILSARKLIHRGAKIFHEIETPPSRVSREIYAFRRLQSSFEKS